MTLICIVLSITWKASCSGNDGGAAVFSRLLRLKDSSVRLGCSSGCDAVCVCFQNSQGLERSLAGLRGWAPLPWQGTHSAPSTHPRREWVARSRSANSALPGGADTCPCPFPPADKSLPDLTWATYSGQQTSRACFVFSPSVRGGRVPPFYCKGYHSSIQIFSFPLSWFPCNLSGGLHG